MTRLLLLGVLTCLSCAGARRHNPQWLFDSPRAAAAEALAPDLFAAAKEAARLAEQQTRRGDTIAAADRRTQSRLLLAAAVVEAERIELEDQRLRLLQEEQDAQDQLEAHQQARIAVSDDIARHKARAIALQEAQRAHQLAESQARGIRTPPKQALSRARAALIERLTLDLAAAEALGAPADKLRTLAARRDELATTTPVRLGEIEHLINQVSALLGQVRSAALQPTFGMTAALMRSAAERGFRVDRLQRGVVVTVERLFSANGRLNTFRVRRLSDLLLAFPHGAVQCGLLVRTVTPSWVHRARLLDNQLRRSGVPEGRVIIEPVPADSAAAVPARCTFVAYGGSHPPMSSP